MFRKALIKMTLFYLLILMTISLFFSLALYQISVKEIQRSLGRQQKNYEKVGPFMRGFLEDPDVLAQQDQDVSLATRTIAWQLIYTNIVILVLGGGLSYYLAVLSIRPIEEAHEAQARFTGDASHELRSPLASMKAEIEVALRDKKLTRDEAIEILNSNLEEVERLSLLSGYLLELSREESVSLRMEHIKVGPIITKAVESVEKRAAEKKINVSTVVDKDIVGFANAESLKDLLVILLDNAIKYSPENTAVKILAKNQGRQTQIRIIDKGIGISKSDAPHLFERFYRADQSRCKNKVEGYGLGLPLAQKIAEGNHAEISVESELGKGSTFIVKLGK